MPQTNLKPAEDNALYIGPSHAEGGIPVVVDDVKLIEVEGDEYKICNDAYYSTDVLDFKGKTNLEVLDNIHGEFSCKFKQDEANSTEFIVCKVVVRDPKPYDRHGTVKEILDAIQNEGHCKLSTGEIGNGKKLQEGGKLSINQSAESPSNSQFSIGGILPQEVIRQVFKPYPTVDFLARKFNVPIDAVRKAVKAGMNEEAEHSDIPEIQRIIALQHLNENIEFYKNTTESKKHYSIGGNINPTQLTSLFKPYPTEQELADKYNVPLSRIKYEVNKGMQHETDHSDLPEVQHIIALQHLNQRLDFYKGISNLPTTSYNLPTTETSDCACEHKPQQWEDFVPTEMQKELVFDYSKIPSNHVVVAWKMIPLAEVELTERLLQGSETKVSQLKTAIENGEEIPACIAHYENGVAKLTDGHHRHQAYTQAGCTHLPIAITIPVDAEMPEALLPYTKPSELEDGGFIGEADQPQSTQYYKITDAKDKPVMAWSLQPLTGYVEQLVFLNDFCKKNGYTIDVVDKEVYQHISNLLEGLDEKNPLFAGHYLFVEKLVKALDDFGNPNLFDAVEDDEFEKGGSLKTNSINFSPSETASILKHELRNRDISYNSDSAFTGSEYVMVFDKKIRIADHPESRFKDRKNDYEIRSDSFSSKIDLENYISKLVDRIIEERNRHDNIRNEYFNSSEGQWQTAKDYFLEANRRSHIPFETKTPYNDSFLFSILVKDIWKEICQKQNLHSDFVSALKSEYPKSPEVWRFVGNPMESSDLFAHYHIMKKQDPTNTLVLAINNLLIEKGVNISDNITYATGGQPPTTSTHLHSILNKDTDLKGERKEPWMFTKPQFDMYPRFAQQLFATKFGIEQDKRERTRGTQTIIDKTRTQTKGETGEEAPTYYFADGRNLYAEIVQKAIDDSLYLLAIKNKEISAQDAATIIESASLQVPQEIENYIKLYELLKAFVGIVKPNIHPLSGKAAFDSLMATNEGKAMMQEMVAGLKTKVSELAVGAQAKLSELEQTQIDLKAEVKTIYEAEKDASWEEKTAYRERRGEIYNQEKKLKNSVIHQKNLVKAYQNGCLTMEITDEKGGVNDNIPYFSLLPTQQISFDESTILDTPPPVYVPYINEEEFRSKGYVFDAIRVNNDKYLVAMNGFKEDGGTFFTNPKLNDSSYPTSDQQGFVLLSLEQLILTNEYYIEFIKATNRRKADEEDKLNEERYDRIPIERRASLLNQKNYYTVLPAAVKKKISQADYEALDLLGKEKWYKPFERASVKRLSSKLDDNEMWGSFHRMYERFIDKNAVLQQKRYAHPDAWKYWTTFRDFMKWKMADLRVQREADSELRKVALETSFGESNTNDSLKIDYGILVKRQNGVDIKPTEIEQIQQAWVAVNNLFGIRYAEAALQGLKISHTADKYVFASKAAGMYVPKMKTIAVSAKFGNEQFQQILAHETAHWIDHTQGQLQNKRHATDDYESLAGQIAITFRRNMNERTDSEYLNATCECFARALEQYFAIETFGPEASLIYSSGKTLAQFRGYFSEGAYIPKKAYEEVVKPMIQEYLKSIDNGKKEITNDDLRMPNEIPETIASRYELPIPITVEDVTANVYEILKQNGDFVTALNIVRNYLNELDKDLAKAYIDSLHLDSANMSNHFDAKIKLLHTKARREINAIRKKEGDEAKQWMDNDKAQRNVDAIESLALEQDSAMQKQISANEEHERLYNEALKNNAELQALEKASIQNHKSLQKLQSDRNSMLKHGIYSGTEMDIKDGLIERTKNLMNEQMDKAQEIRKRILEEVKKQLTIDNEQLTMAEGGELETRDPAIFNNPIITFDDFHLDTFANFTKIKAKEVPSRPADFVSRSGSKYWYVGDSVIRQSNHWGRTIASCNWLIDSKAHQGETQGICKLSDFVRQRIGLLLKPGAVGKRFQVGKTVLQRNGGGKMDIDEYTGVFKNYTWDYYIFDNFKVGSQTIAYVKPLDEFTNGGILNSRSFTDIPVYRGEGNVVNATYGGTDDGMGKFYTDSKLMAEWFAGLIEYDSDKEQYVKTGKNGNISESKITLQKPYVIDSNHTEYDIENGVDSYQVFMDEIAVNAGMDKFKAKLKESGFDGIVLADCNTNYYEDGLYSIYIDFETTGGQPTDTDHLAAARARLQAKMAQKKTKVLPSVSEPKALDSRSLTDLESKRLSEQKFQVANLEQQYLAPNGQPSNLNPMQYALVRTPEFREWFGDWETLERTKMEDPGIDDVSLAALSKNVSKVVDENGEPLVVYHRSKTNINTFDSNKQLNAWLGKGFYFSENKFEFKKYGSKLTTAFLCVKKPFKVKGESPSDFLSECKNVFPNADKTDTTEILRSNSYDGVIYKHWDFEGRMISCFHPTQIKLADGSNTTFNPSSLDIRYECGGEIQSFIDSKEMDIECYETTPSHAAEYGLKAEKPLYLKTLCVNPKSRLKGIGVKILKHLDDFALKNNYDIIFGHIANKAEFKKHSHPTTHFCDVDLIKYWLHENGYSVNEENNDFHKVIQKHTPPTIFWRGGGKGSFPKNATLADVINYETEELGNDIKLTKGIKPAEVSSSNLQWLTFTKSAAKEYGIPEKVELQNYRVVATDNYNGCVVETLD